MYLKSPCYLISVTSDLGFRPHVCKQMPADHVDQVQSRAIYEYNPNSAKCSPPECKRVTGPGRALRDGKEAYQRVELVCQRYRYRHFRRRHRIVGAGRLVVIADGIGDLGILAVMQRVVAAHHA